VEQTAGNWADTKDGVSIWFPVFAGIGARLGERCWAGLYWLTFTGWLLLANSRRSSLAVQFGEKRFFLQRIAGPQQFQKRILGVGSAAAGLA